VKLALVALAACATRTTGPLSADALMAHVAVVADARLAGREAGSEGEAEAARYVEAQLTRIGLQPRSQPIPADGGRNLWAIVPGASEDVVIVGAHLDHLGRRDGRLHPGAEDDASGVALVLGLAEELASRRAELARSVMVVWFGAEEVGMAGSRHFVANPPLPLARVAAMVNIDMIARPLLDQPRYRPLIRIAGIDRDTAVGLAGARRYPGLRALADAAVGDVIAGEDLPDAIEREVDRATARRGDSTPFEDAGIPALFFGSGESSDYHAPTDTIDRLHPAILERRARAIARLVVALSTAPAAAFVASDAPPPKRTPARGWYLPIGFANGVAIGGGTRYVLGGEASLVYLFPQTISYVGAYADVLRDAGRWRFSIGPELGRRWWGVDGGYAQIAGHRGGVARVFATASIVSLALRVGYVDGWLGELDLLLKYPFAVRTRH
jgi:hypothetical protein